LNADSTHLLNACRGSVFDELERSTASIRAKVEHPFRVIALSNLWMARRRPMAAMG